MGFCLGIKKKLESQTIHRDDQILLINLLTPA